MLLNAARARGRVTAVTTCHMMLNAARAWGRVTAVTAYHMLLNAAWAWERFVYSITQTVSNMVDTFLGGRRGGGGVEIHEVCKGLWAFLIVLFGC